MLSNLFKCVPRSVLRVGGYDEATWRLLGNGPRSGGEGHQIYLLAGEGLRKKKIVRETLDEDNSDEEQPGAPDMSWGRELARL